MKGSRILILTYTLLICISLSVFATQRIGVLVIPPWFYEEDYQFLTDQRTYVLLKKIRMNIYNLLRNTVPVVGRELRRSVRTKHHIAPGNKRKLAQFYRALFEGGECNGRELFDSDYLECVALNRGARVVVLAQLFINREEGSGENYLQIAIQVYNMANNVINTKNIQYPMDSILHRLSELELEIKRKVVEALHEAIYGESVGQDHDTAGGHEVVHGF